MVLSNHSRSLPPVAVSPTRCIRAVVYDSPVLPILSRMSRFKSLRSVMLTPSAQRPWQPPPATTAAEDVDDSRSEDALPFAPLVASWGVGRPGLGGGPPPRPLSSVSLGTTSSSGARWPPERPFLGVLDMENVDCYIVERTSETPPPAARNRP